MHRHACVMQVSALVVHASLCNVYDNAFVMYFNVMHSQPAP